MAAKENLTCFECKGVFDRNDMVKFGVKYVCPNCAPERQERQEFSDYICHTFHLKTPGPRIWTTRKRYLNQGFTHETMMLVLRYIYDVKKVKVLTINDATIGLITSYKEEALEYWKSEKEKEQKKMNEAKEPVFVEVEVENKLEGKNSSRLPYLDPNLLF